MAYIKADTPVMQKYFDFLERLRQSGDTNMVGSPPYLQAAYHLSREKAVSIVSDWMKAHNDPARILTKPTSTDTRRVRFETSAVVEDE